MDKVTLNNHKRKLNFNVQFGIETFEVRQPSLVDEFYYMRHDSPRESTLDAQSVSVCNPLYMLFNQQRLDRLGPHAVNAWLQAMKDAGHKPVNEILQKVSDDDLLQMVKPRCIQAPCELEMYINELNSRADLFNTEVARIRAEQEAERLAQEQADKDAANKVESQMK